jgi:hypothetical protein
MHDVGYEEGVQDCGEQEEMRIERPRRSKPEPAQNDVKKRRPVKDRWFYETVPATANSHGMLNEKEALITRTATMNDVLEDLPGIGSSQARAPNLGYAGPVECLPGYLEHATDTDESAWDIQGMIFEDKEIGWCEVTGWAVDHGVRMIFYFPLAMAVPGLVGQQEHHVSFQVLLGSKNIMFRWRKFCLSCGEYRFRLGFPIINLLVGYNCQTIGANRIR